MKKLKLDLCTLSIYVMLWVLFLVHLPTMLLTFLTVAVTITKTVTITLINPNNRTGTDRPRAGGGRGHGDERAPFGSERP